jgi:hypothetical protein
MKLAARRCLVHADREAAARCPACHQYYCRECVVEHEDRFLCAACLQKSIEAGTKRHAIRFDWLSPFRLLLGFACTYVSFYVIERILLLIPLNLYNGAWLGK